jgi:uncharacterized protein YdeI (YjbR/CyaY-like superfamily)
VAKKDPRIDAYIAKSAPFAQPILKKIRTLVHKGAPGVEETMKWSFPHFDYKGMLCSMASFKSHCTFGFWKHTLIKDPRGVLSDKGDEAMGNLGRIGALSDLPSDRVIVGFVKQAALLNDKEVKLPPRTRKPQEPLTIPKILTDALKKNSKAAATFKMFTYSHKKEYVEWITEAKQEATKLKRLETALEWLAEGKPRNWKYM